MVGHQGMASVGTPQGPEALSRRVAIPSDGEGMGNGMVPRDCSTKVQPAPTLKAERGRESGRKTGGQCHQAKEHMRLEWAQAPCPPPMAYHVPPMYGYGSSVVPGLNVCPVQVGASPMAPMVYPLPLENIRAGAQAAGIVEPRFDGNFADFEVKWPIYLRQLAELYPMSITEGIKLNLLKGAIGSSAQTELERRYEANKSIKYQDF